MPASPPLHEPTQQRLAECLQRFRQDHSDGAVPIALALRCGVQSDTVSSAVGSQPAQFLAYSCSKTLLAVVVLQLCAEGRFSLETALARWYPAIPRAAAMTLRMLLNHTSGLPDYGTLADYHTAVRSSPSRPWSRNEILGRTLMQGLAFAPGQGWGYSNLGYLLLRSIVELECGAPLAELFSARIFMPLGLEESFVPESVADLYPLQPAFSRLVTTSGAAVDVRSVYHPDWVAHGVVATTAADLAAIYHRLFAGELLSAHSLQEMIQAVTVPTAPPHYGAPGYGLGLMIDSASHFGVLRGHNGGGPGYQASVFHAPDCHGQPVTICALCAAETPGLAESLVLATFAELEPAP